MKGHAKNLALYALHKGPGLSLLEVRYKMSSYTGYTGDVTIALSSYYQAKEEAFIKAKEDKEGRRALLRKQRIEGGF